MKTMKSVLFAALIVTICGVIVTGCANRRGNRQDNRIDNRGDRAENRND